MKNLLELKQEFMKRASQSNLKVECAMDGTFFSDKAIVAEAPGDREVVQKLPLVGGAGAILWRSLHKYAQLGRKDFYITNVSKRLVSSAAKDTRKAINKHELDLWTELLLWELGCLPNLRTVIVLGNYALEALTGNSGILDWRGSVLHTTIRDSYTGEPRPITVICSVNPAALSKNPRLEISFNMDMARVKKVLNGTHKPWEVTTKLYPTSAEIDKFIDEATRSPDPIGTDIEVIGGETACIGFADSSSTAMCVAFRNKTDHIYSTKEEMYIRRRIQEFYKSDTRFIAQKGMFDITWLWYKDKIRIPKLWFDTLLGHHVLYPPLPHNLGFLTTQYTDNPYYKDEKTGWREGGDIDEFWRYNGKDCAYLLAIVNKMIPELRSQGLEDFFFSHVMRLLPHLAEMTVGGILTDVTMKADLNDELSEKVAQLLAQFQQACIDATGNPDIYYNPASPKQMSDLYFSKLKLVGRGVSTDKENRDRMYRHPRTKESARKIIRLHDEYAKEAKFFGTYVKMSADDDNRMRCEWSQTNVQEAPGRLSSGQVLWGHYDEKNELVKHGGNFQNQPKRAYPMFVADEGYGFAYFDMAQIEARIVGWEAKIERWIEQFERARIDKSYDAHRALASDLFKVPYDQVPSFDHYDISKPNQMPPEGKVDGDITIRYLAKRCRHGLNYRMGPDRLATTAGISLAEADRAYRIYHRETPELRIWWQSLEEELDRNKALYNVYGRRYKLFERKSPEALEALVAFKPQSTNGDHVCRVIYQSHDHPKWPKRVRIRLNVHDALVALGKLDELPMALSIMKFYAEQPMYIHGRELIVPADCKLSYPDEKGIHRWSQLKTAEIESANTSSLSTASTSSTPGGTTT